MRLPWLVLLCASLTLGCGDDGDADTTSSDEDSTSAGPTTSAESSTSGESTSVTTTGEESTTGDADTTSTATTDADTTGTDSTTGDVAGFERFLLEDAAGPCAPDMDCDGFLELLGDGTLRVETFGDPAKEVVEVQIDADDLAAAAAVFADPALVALLDGADPICKPPTDIFESMTVEIDGTSHDATTTGCDDAPLVAARAMAEQLATEYVP